MNVDSQNQQQTELFNSKPRALNIRGIPLQSLNEIKNKVKIPYFQCKQLRCDMGSYFVRLDTP